MAALAVVVALGYLLAWLLLVLGCCWDLLLVLLLPAERDNAGMSVRCYCCSAVTTQVRVDIAVSFRQHACCLHQHARLAPVSVRHSRADAGARVS